MVKADWFPALGAGLIVDEVHALVVQGSALARDTFRRSLMVVVAVRALAKRVRYHSGRTSILMPVQYIEKI